MISCEGEWVGLDICQREGSWHVKAHGCKEVLRAAVLKPPVRELLYGQRQFKVDRFEKCAGVALGWEVLCEAGFFCGVDPVDCRWVLPVVLRDSRWRARLERHREEFMEQLPHSLERFKYILCDLRSAFYSRLLDKVLCEGTEVSGGAFFPSASFFVETPAGSEDEDMSSASDGCQSEPVRRTCDRRRARRRDRNFEEHQAEISRICENVLEAEERHEQVVPTLRHLVHLCRMRR